MASADQFEFFLKKPWSDGLPVVTPTEERVRWMLGVPGASMTDRIAPVVAATNVNYRAPIVWPNDIVVELFVERLGNSSVTIGHRIVDQKDERVLYSDGNVVVVWMDTQTGKSAPLPDAIRNAST